ncbi:MAG: alpha/beta hydrolase-fold protein [bacterium]
MKRNVIIFLYMIFQIAGTYAQSFQQFIEQLYALPEAQRQAAVDSFLNAGHTFPFTESDTLVSFVYRGNGQSLTLAGDASVWNPDIDLIQVPGTNFWYHSTHYEANARLDYKFVLNGSSWILDPLNPNTCLGGFGPNSELRMPDYVVPPEIAFDPSIPHGTLEDTLFASTNLGNTRTVKIYLPPGYSVTAQNYPVALFHDGIDYINLGDVRNIFDYLIAHQLMVPVIGIFVPPVDRTEEYAGSKKELFRKFIVEELMPALDQRYRTDTSAQKRAMIGASNGGNISLYIGMKNPEIFGKIGAQSSNIQNMISNTFQGSDKLDLKLYLDIGVYDIPTLIPLVKNFVNILQSKGYVYEFFEFPEGHSWGSWKGHLRLALIQFFPYQTGMNENRPARMFDLKQNYPNNP